jgi:hypothetical protein
MLSDPSPDARAAALSVEGGIRSAPIKANMLELARQDDAPDTLRSRAVAALRQQDLSADERDALQNALSAAHVAPD